VRSAKRFTIKREVFMIHASKDYEGLERVQLDDYGDYLLDPLDEGVDVTMSIELPDNIKIEDVDNIQKEHCKPINTKRTERRHLRGRDEPAGAWQPLRLLHGRPPHHHQCRPGCSQCNHRQAAGEVEAHSPADYQIPLDYLETTR
jgi:hypothetical protein